MRLPSLVACCRSLAVMIAMGCLLLTSGTKAQNLPTQPLQRPGALPATPPSAQPPPLPPPTANKNPTAVPPNTPPLPPPASTPSSSPGAAGSLPNIDTMGLVKPLPGENLQGASPPKSSANDLLLGIIEDYKYTSSGKRDPFMPFEGSRMSSTPLGPIYPLQKFDLDQLKLVGVIWDVRTPKALIMDPTGKDYVVKVREKIGRNNGYIARIREGEIIVVEAFTNPEGRVSYQSKTIRVTPQQTQPVQQ